jgi:hypothetical protein
MKRSLGIIVGVGLPLLCPDTSWAASPADATSHEASMHFERGVKLSEDEDWRAALIEFERAYALEPNYRVLFDIGQCRYQLHEYPGALAAFRQYVADGKDAIAADRRVLVESDIDVLKGRVATVRLSSGFSGADVSVDDVIVGATPLVAPIVVSAGRRKLTLSKAGGPSVTRFIDLAGEETAEVTIDPPAASADVARAPFAAPIAMSATPEPRAHRPSLVPAWTALSLGVVGAGVGAFFGVSAMSDKRDLDRQCVSKICPLSSQSLVTTSERNSLYSTIGFVAGAASLTFGAGYLIFAPGAARARPTAPRLGLFIDRRSVGAAGVF